MTGIEMANVSFRYRQQSGGNSSIQKSSNFAIYIRKLNVARGECIALVGPSGSGKTTLLGLIAGNLRPQGGRVCVNGREISQLGGAAVRQFRIGEVGQVFQSFELLDYLSILENIMLPWFIDRGPSKTAMSKTDCRRRALKLLEEVGLSSQVNSRPGQLSQGEQQRIAVCRAMLNHPSLTLADEPTGNLDQANKQMVVDLLLRQARDNDSTLLMVTHDQSLLERFDTVLEINSVTAQGKAI